MCVGLFEQRGWGTPAQEMDPAAATGLFVAGTAIALFDLTIRDTSGDTGLPALLGWVGLLPCLAGLVMVITLWRPESTSSTEHLRKGTR